jgi:hypothetical protein
MRAVQREVEIYNRNRETLLDLREASVRAGISVLIARLSFAIDGVIDASAGIAMLESEGKTETLAELKDGRTTAFEFAVETALEIAPLLAQLAPLAQHNFGATESAVPQDVFANPAPEEAR